MGTYGESYGGAIAEFWREVFGRLPAVARVLDVASGNGALPRLLVEHCRSPGVQCDAVDIAAVQLPWIAKLPPGDRQRVRLHGGVDATALPFPEGVFDLVVSQYGIEYAGLDIAVAEALRVCRGGGGIAMVLHHAAGRPATLARIELEHIRWLEQEHGWFEATAAMVEPMARTATFGGRASLQDDAKANAARDRFNRVQNELTVRATAGDGADVLFEMRDAAMATFELAAREGAAVAGKALEAARQELSAGATRLDDLCTHALGPERARAVCERLERALGVPVALAELREEAGHLMGWTLRSRPSG